MFLFLFFGERSEKIKETGKNEEMTTIDQQRKSETHIVKECSFRISEQKVLN